MNGLLESQQDRTTRWRFRKYTVSFECGFWSKRDLTSWDGRCVAIPAHQDLHYIRKEYLINLLILTSLHTSCDSMLIRSKTLETKKWDDYLNRSSNFAAWGDAIRVPMREEFVSSREQANIGFVGVWQSMRKDKDDAVAWPGRSRCPRGVMWWDEHSDDCILGVKYSWHEVKRVKRKHAHWTGMGIIVTCLKIMG